MNEQIISNFESLAAQTKKEEGNSFRVKSHYKVIKIIKNLDFEIENSTQIANIKGIGKSTLKRVDEILETGTLAEIKSNQNNIDNLGDLERITGVGPVKAKKLFEKGLTLQKILDDCKNGVLEEDFTSHQLLGLKHFHDLEKRIPYKEITQINKFLEKELSKITDNIELQICGSYRREMPTSGDIDVLFFSKDETKEHNDFLPTFLEHLESINFLVDHLTSLTSKTKYMGMCKFKSNPVRRIDIRYIPRSSLGAALLYFTGSGDFNMNMRGYAVKKGYTINEYGIYKLKKDKTKGMKLKTRTEKDIFDVLDLKYVEPKDRLPTYKFD